MKISKRNNNTKKNKFFPFPKNNRLEKSPDLHSQCFFFPLHISIRTTSSSYYFFKRERKRERVCHHRNLSRTIYRCVYIYLDKHSEKSRKRKQHWNKRGKKSISTNKFIIIKHFFHDFLFILHNEERRRKKIS